MGIETTADWVPGDNEALARLGYILQEHIPFALEDAPNVYQQAREGEYGAAAVVAPPAPLTPLQVEDPPAAGSRRTACDGWPGRAQNAHPLAEVRVLSGLWASPPDPVRATLLVVAL